MIHQQLLDACCDVARRAGEAVLRHYGEMSGPVSRKDDGSPLTAADLASHELIAEALPAIAPYTVISEESFEADPGTQRPDPFWLVDPLDGTKDFLARNGEFTVNIALISQGAPVLGVVAIPALGLVYGAAHALGAWRIDEVGKTPIEYRPVAGRLLGAESRFHPAAETELMAQRVGATGILTFGSSLKLCKLAEGDLDFYTRFKPTSGWDTAAGHAVLREAGCELYAMPEGVPLSYSLNRIINPPFLAVPRCRAGHLIAEMAGILAETR